MPVKIGLITGEFPPMEGGVGAFTQEVARELACLGHDVHILTSRAARPQMEDANFRELTQPVALPFATLYPFIRKWRWPALAEVTDWVIRQRLELVNIQYQAAAYEMRSPAVNLLPWRLRGVVKTAVTFHDLRVPYLFPKAGRLRETAVYFMAKQANGVIVTNQADYEALRRVGVAAACLRQIPIGSNITTHMPTADEIAAARAALGLTAAHHLLGYFGFLNESKGADTLLAALAALDAQTHLLFIGGQTGSSDATNQAFLAQMRAQITALGLDARVHWTGFVPDERVSTFLHAADVMVMPYRDGVSLRRGTLMAVLAHGRPLITTLPLTPTPELAHGEQAWLVPPDDVAALAQAMRTLLGDVSLRQRLGAGAAQVAGLFTWDKIVGETAVFFDELLQK
ncbi:MAG: glycosyltransferase family 4 protein [Ardenticatenaceae bacterium]|nr:glycosyltransferase family 4 protein [Ardenticatenaceae bacterium]